MKGRLVHERILLGSGSAVKRSLVSRVYPHFLGVRGRMSLGGMLSVLRKHGPASKSPHAYGVPKACHPRDDDQFGPKNFRVDPFSREIRVHLSILVVPVF